MAFLDNSGDIILDAVLTDTGRFRMARGDFRISKFALGDDEIDYSLFNKNHPSGSAYYDLEILRTPILEAFTNNTSLMKSKLLTITRTNLLFLPVMKLLNGGNAAAKNTGPDLTAVANTAINPNTAGYIVTVDESTEQQLVNQANPSANGIIKGSTATTITNSPNSIVIERGLDTTKLPPNISMPATLQETQFIIEMDHRLGSLVSTGAESVPVSFIDDDQIASYYISENTVDTSNPIVIGLGGGGSIRPDSALNAATTDSADVTIHNIRGPRDRMVRFKISPSINLRNSTFLFDKLGGSKTLTLNEITGFKAGTYLFIDTLVRVTSATTAYSIDIPIRYMKKQ
tara:strand:- start:168 stop:1199 length:1032 start_codon:yes stop_codon:yes gene_type:complete